MRVISDAHAEADARQQLVAYVVPQPASALVPSADSEQDVRWQQLADAGRTAIRDYRDEHAQAMRVFEAWWLQTEQLAPLIAATALAELGLFRTAGECHTVASLAAAAGLSAARAPVLAQWLDLLVAHGWLSQRDAPADAYRATTAFDAGRLRADTDALLAGLTREGHYAALADMLCTAAKHQLDFLRGEMQALELLFPSGSSSVADIIYQRLPIMAQQNTAAAAVLKEIADRLPFIRVLEVGAGVGGTTASLLPMLPPDRTHYCYTDVSTAFFDIGRTRYADYPFIDYRLLDMNQHPQSQGFGANEFDVVVAANVLHNAAHLRRTLRELRGLLKPGGVLMLLETVRTSPIQMVTIVHLESFGHSEDASARRGTMVMMDEWRTSLHRAGFRGLTSIPGNEDAAGDLVGQRLMLAQAPADLSQIDTRQLPEQLRHWLPAYMVPQHFFVLDTLPLSSNGKVDLQALPVPQRAPQAMHETDRDHAAPVTDTERALAGLWSTLLSVPVDRVGLHDDFFALGGDSLLATRLVVSVREQLGVELPVRAVLEASTLSDLAGKIDGACGRDDASVPLIEPAVRPDPMPLSFAQQRMWFLDQLEPGSAVYNFPVAVQLRGPLDLPVLEQVFTHIFERHESLRTRIPTIDGVGVQVIDVPQAIKIPVVDLSALPADGRESAARAAIDREAATPFDLARGPLARVGLLRLGDQEHVLLITMHHAISDGWSIGVIHREFTTLYPALLQGQPSPLPALPIQYADFTLWQQRHLQGRVLQRQIDFWKQHLHGAPALLELPTDRPRPAVQRYRGATLPFQFDRPLTEQLLALSMRAGATPYMSLLSALGVLLSRYSRQPEVVIGSPIANRNQPGLEPMVGYFANTLALRHTIDPDASFLDLLARTKEHTLNAHAHQDLPFERLVDALNIPRSLSYTPVFQVLFVLQMRNIEYGESALALNAGQRLTLRPLPNEAGVAKFDLSFDLRETAEGLAGTVEYNTDLFDRVTIERLVRHFRTLLSAIVADPAQRLGQLPWLDARERRQVLVDWNDTHAEYPPDSTIHQLFEEQVRRTPQATALVSGPGSEAHSLTYAELNERANQLAHHLIAHDVQPDQLVGLCMARSLEMIVGILGILKAGAAYLPIDPAYPEERLAYMLSDAKVRLLVTQETLVATRPSLTALPVDEEADSHAMTVFCLDRDADQLRGLSKRNPSRHDRADVTTLHPDDLAYCIYTSGSTGRPKGVGITHRSAATFIHWALGVFDKAALSNVLASTSVCFDLSIFEMFVPLACGGRVTVVGNILDLVSAGSPVPVTLINTVPSAIAQLHEAQAIPVTVKVVNLAGEALQNALVQRVYTQGSIEKIYNLYGPTESTTYSTYALTERGSSRPVTIGKPVANTQVYLLDAQLNPVPVGVAGEVHIAGAGLARGYLNRPELTAERFLRNPFEAEAGGGARMYRTGDLARYLPDGHLDYLGRVDHQVKARGYRIELGEVEAALVALPAVRDAVVLAREDVPGDKRLVAYLVIDTAHAADATHAHALRDALGRTLPDYMVPPHLVFLDRLPLNANGKVDRQALPAPDAASLAAEAYVAPRTDTEQRLAAIWSALLGLPLQHVGLHDNFFALGGHSLLATQLVSRIGQSLNAVLPIVAVFGSPTLEGLARAVDAAKTRGRGAGLPAIVPMRRDQPLPLSYAQQRLWFIHEHLPGRKTDYNMAYALRLTGVLDVAALRVAVQALVARHEILRTTFVMRAGGDAPVQVVHAHQPVDVPVRAVTEAEVTAQAEAHANHVFDLTHGPLLKLTLLRLAAESHVLLLNMHHIVSDGWSLGVMARELSHLYGAARRGEAASLPSLAVQYADYAHWQRSLDLSAHVAHWQAALASYGEGVSLPGDKATLPSSGMTRRLVHRYPDVFAQGLWQSSVAHGATPFMMLLTGLLVVLARRTGRDDIAIGTTAAGRDDAGVEPLIGFFINILPIRVDLSGDPTGAELIERVKQAALGAYEHQALPYEQILAAGSGPGRPHRPGRGADTSLVPVMLRHQNFPDIAFEGELGQLAGQRLPMAEQAVKCDIDLQFYGQGRSLELVVEYAADRYAPASMARLVHDHQRILDALLLAPERPLSSYELPTAASAPQAPGSEGEDLEKMLARMSDDEAGAFLKSLAHLM